MRYKITLAHLYWQAQVNTFRQGGLHVVGQLAYDINDAGR